VQVFDLTLVTADLHLIKTKGINVLANRRTGAARRADAWPGRIGRHVR
jgi:hypothetical protein